MFLFEEEPIFGNKVLAREIGLIESIILQKIYYWIQINKNEGRNYYDGKYWTYNSIRTWHEKEFNYVSIATVKRAFNKLESLGFLLVANYNKDSRDKTKWYSVNEEKLSELYREVDSKTKKKQKEVLEKNKVENVDNSKQDERVNNALVQNDPMQEINLNQCIVSNCTNGLGQNELMQSIKMSQPLPNNTTINNSYNTSVITSNPSIHPINLESDKNSLDIDRGNDGEIDGLSKNTNKKYLETLDILRKNVGYYELIDIDRGLEAKEYDYILQILAEVFVSDSKSVKINGEQVDINLVRERYLKLDQFHMEYITYRMKENEYKIRNIRAYILTASYNAVVDMDIYYRNLVSYNEKNGMF